jgi:hypothetical protein
MISGIRPTRAVPVDTLILSELLLDDFTPDQDDPSWELQWFGVEHRAAPHLFEEPAE